MTSTITLSGSAIAPQQWCICLAHRRIGSSARTVIPTGSRQCIRFVTLDGRTRSFRVRNATHRRSVRNLWRSITRRGSMSARMKTEDRTLCSIAMTSAPPTLPAPLATAIAWRGDAENSSVCLVYVRPWRIGRITHRSLTTQCVCVCVCMDIIISQIT